MGPVPETDEAAVPRAWNPFHSGKLDALDDLLDECDMEPRSSSLRPGARG